MASKAIYAVVAVAGIALASGAAWWYQKPRAANTAPAGAGPAPAGAAAGSAGKPVTVEAAKVEIATLVDDAQAVGSLRSRRSVVLRPEVSGRITRLNFTDGQRVRKGQLLVQFDDQLPMAQVQQGQAELSIAQANQKRNQELVAQNFVSQRSLDESAANLQVAQAKLSLARATASRLKIVAPFDGIVGIRMVNVGDYLKDGADIVNIEDIDALFVDFRLPERFQSKVQRGQVARVEVDALPGQKYTAVVQAIDPLIDANGRSVAVRA
ncbi:MAG: efflux RND transporter periplasmic adaptor subunit, partial [Polaromonas sp.]